MAQRSLVARLEKRGTSVWLDYIHRDLLTGGEFRRMVRQDDVLGLTSNPTIFQQAITESQEYDAQIEAMAREGKKPEDIFRALACDDIRTAADILRPIYEQLHGGDGYACLSILPQYATDTASIVREAHRLWNSIARPNVMIQIPATEAGTPALEQLTYEGINIDITLIFDAATYRDVADAYLAGIERRVAARQQTDYVASLASFFLSRVDTAVDELIDQKLKAERDREMTQRLQALKGEVAVANAKVAFEEYERVYAQPRWHQFAYEGAMPQRPLWVSMSVKNPEFSDIKYVEALIGGNTVMTLPRATLEAFQHHGKVDGATVNADLPSAHRIMDEVSAVGIDVAAVARRLQTDGLATFAGSIDRLLASIEQKAASRRVAIVG
jgi:transaldolase/glucose-6-phosphate isomerase